MLTPTQKEALRKKSLGELGELVAIKALVDSSFTGIKNLNDVQQNYPFVDILAEKNGQRFAISVKARNKFQANASLNARYKLGAKANDHARSAEVELDAEAYWMAIPFDSEHYSVYLGSMASLGGKLGIPVGKCINEDFGECLVENRRHYFDFSFFTNQK